ncbi:MAG: class II glutamine amidotransferase [Flavobacterium sp.]
MAGNIGIKEEKMFKDLLVLDSLRGFDSVGVAALHSNKEVTVLKKAMSVMDFMDLKAFDSLMKRKNAILMGHNRYATKGVVNNTNAHPFDFETLVGAHNGTLTGQWRLNNHKDYAVDSENIFHHIEELGVEDLWGKLDGAAALTWIDKTDQSINFLRNKERTLYICPSEDGKTVFWASEKWMLIVASNRQDVKLDTEKLDMLPENTHININFNGDAPEIKVKKLEPYVYVYTPPANQYNHVNLLEKVGKKIGDFLSFEVDKVMSFGASSMNDVYGRTYNGTAIRILSVPNSNRKLIDALATSTNCFKAKIVSQANWGAVPHLVLSEYSCVEIGFAFEEQEDEKEAVGKK